MTNEYKIKVECVIINWTERDNTSRYFDSTSERTMINMKTPKLYNVITQKQKIKLTYTVITAHYLQILMLESYIMLLVACNIWVKMWTKSYHLHTNNVMNTATTILV